MSQNINQQERFGQNQLGFDKTKQFQEKDIGRENLDSAKQQFVGSMGEERNIGCGLQAPNLGFDYNKSPIVGGNSDLTGAKGISGKEGFLDSNVSGLIGENRDDQPDLTMERNEDNRYQGLSGQQDISGLDPLKKVRDQMSGQHESQWQQFQNQ